MKFDRDLNSDEMPQIHTYIQCSKCSKSIRASKLTPEECEEWQKFGRET